MTVEERLTRLERENSKLKRVLFLVGLVSASFILMAQAAPGAPGAGSYTIFNARGVAVG